MKNLIKIGIFIILCGISFSSYAQEEIMRNYHLKHELTQAEYLKLQTYQRNFTTTLPPEGIVRNIAEWEPMESVIIGYDSGFGIPIEGIVEMTKDCMVTVLVADAEEENAVTDLISDNNGDVNNLDFVYHDVNSWWSRDYSPWFISLSDTAVAIVDFPYNRPRPQDDEVPIVMASHLNLNLYGMDVIQTGGNYMTDGLGIGASTDLVVEENPEISETEVRERMQNYLGIQNYMITADPLGAYIKHIDCWGKFLAPDKVIITQVPQSDPRYNDYEAVAQIFANQNCSYGYPFEVVRVQAPSQYDYHTTPYTNSLILNKKVFLPVAGSSYDNAAIQTYQNNMPGYEIVPVYSAAGWENTDALHCRTHGVADRQMIHIVHTPVKGNIEYTNIVNITAKVHGYGAEKNKDKTVELHYKTGNNDWVTTPMTLSDDNYTADIEWATSTDTVDYYIKVTDEDGKIATHPHVGEAAAYRFFYKNSTGNCERIETKFALYPNPTRGILFLEAAKGSDYRITNSTGKIVSQGKVNSDKQQIDLSSLTKGIYFLEINSIGKSRFEKIIKR